jgi:hypothetical protein
MSSPASTPWITSGGFQGDIGNGAGVVGDYDHNGLIDELEQAWLYINSLAAEHEIDFNDGDFDEYKNDGYSSLNLNAIDTAVNGLGLVVIDIIGDGTEFLLNNYDWIINGTDDVFGIFRLRGDTNMNMSNSSIALGTGGIGGGSSSNPPTHLGAVFVQYEEPVGHTDQVFNFDNVILNGIGFWDLNAFRNGVYNDSVNTELDVQNGQGCSQFISSSVTHTSSARWTRCAPAAEVPEPATTLGFVLLGVAALAAPLRRRAVRD